MKPFPDLFLLIDISSGLTNISTSSPFETLDAISTFPISVSAWLSDIVA